MTERILVKAIVFCGRTVVLACDGLCDKAWGIADRPRVDDVDLDSPMLPDDQLGTAPTDLGTYEGGDTKPVGDAPDRQNRWCARSCERSRMLQHGWLDVPRFTEPIP